ncbi:MAG: 4-(cytidine 5'-diphospho)-2-C-methyl-D-erythritol kinase [Pseudomonadota bacterium]
MPPHTELARAKINLALHIVGRRSDGYHELDSIVAFAGIADRLTFERADDWHLDLTGPFAAELANAPDNLVLKAARGFVQTFADEARYHISLEKHLPVASGIGGGSADAAATLRALTRLSGKAVDPGRLSALAASLGADVPVCLTGKSCRMRGIGERIDLLPDLAPMSAVLVNPRREVATAQVFARLALKPGDQAFAGLEAGADLSSCRNDLAPPALAVAPVIGEVIAALQDKAGLRFARMSGSGATCFGIFAWTAAAEAAARDIATAYPGWWVMPTVIG